MRSEIVVAIAGAVAGAVATAAIGWLFWIGPEMARQDERIEAIKNQMLTTADLPVGVENMRGRLDMQDGRIEALAQRISDLAAAGQSQSASLTGLAEQDKANLAAIESLVLRVDALENLSRDQTDALAGLAVSGAADGLQDRGIRVKCAEIMARAMDPPSTGPIAGYRDQDGNWRTSKDDVRDMNIRLYRDLNCGVIAGPAPVR
ncbi:MAG: hypothetical protein Q4G14_05160 [Paracoccus sp. (in: a-proteobacteria)]|uniref:hypothetical protein n=1 Tax=Paracoccus sp. TaxID=267 RepID=UPI0026DFB39F|nr:hypothetical protein [Paracoccus sp. (in: a-proteobacteria)]MDO5612615.1 hypothetical protein [Paracoccus sp. (in: a-proteobacteria)]